MQGGVAEGEALLPPGQPGFAFLPWVAQAALGHLPFTQVPYSARLLLALLRYWSRPMARGIVEALHLIEL